MDREDILKIGITLGVVVLDVIGFLALGLNFAWSSAWKVALAWPVLMGLAWFYTARRPEETMARILRETAHLIAFSAAAAMLSYLAVGLAFPLIDDGLVAADRLVGFRWDAYVGFVNAHPWLGHLSSLLYISTLPQVVLVAVLLPLLHKTERARQFVLAVMLGALISIAISAVLPSGGALAFHRPDISFYGLNHPVVDLEYKAEFFRMRALEIPVLSLDQPKGLIAFPSFHVALSALIVLAFRGVPIVFPVLLAINIGVILATPIDGGHHLADALGGLVVALVAFGGAAAIRRGLERPGMLAARPRIAGLGEPAG